MTLTIKQAASQLGMTVRQVRYMIQQGKLAARKIQGRWIIDSGDLPTSDQRVAAGDRKARQLRGLVDDALAVPQELRFSPPTCGSKRIPMQGLPGR